MGWEVQEGAFTPEGWVTLWNPRDPDSGTHRVTPWLVTLLALLQVIPDSSITFEPGFQQERATLIMWKFCQCKIGVYRPPLTPSFQKAGVSLLSGILQGLLGPPFFVIHGLLEKSFLSIWLCLVLFLNVVLIGGSSWFTCKILLLSADHGLDTNSKSSSPSISETWNCALWIVHLFGSL